MRIKNIVNRVKKVLAFRSTYPCLDDGGERVDIYYSKSVDFDRLDMYQKSHYRRYEFAREFVPRGSVCGDFACGTGYGSVMLSEKSRNVIGADSKAEVIHEIRKRYHKISNVEFINSNLLHLNYELLFDTIVSFETIEHFAEDEILKLLRVFYKALKPRGILVFSVPFMQEKSEDAMELGFHMTFYINEDKIEKWLCDTGFTVLMYKCQNYDTHVIQDKLIKNNFIICIAEKT